MTEDYIEKLIKSAGKRPSPDEDTVEDVRGATERAWREAIYKNKQRNLKKFLVLVNIAAVILIGVWGFISYIPTFTGPQNTEVGSIVYADDSFQLNDLVSMGVTVLRTGDTLTTRSNSLLTVDLLNATQLTFAPNTSVEFTGIATMHLIKGKLYIDSPGQNSSVVIETEWGTVQDIGTQFEITVGGDKLTVAMREGKVKMNLGDKVEYATFNDGKGDVVSINKARNIERKLVQATDDYWSWTIPAIKALNLKDVSIYDMLEWVSRVTGKEIVYNSNEANNMARQTHFSAGNLEANVIESVLPTLFETTTLTLKIDNHTIMVLNNN